MFFLLWWLDLWLDSRKKTPSEWLVTWLQRKPQPNEWLVTWLQEKKTWVNDSWLDFKGNPNPMNDLWLDSKSNDLTRDLEDKITNDLWLDSWLQMLWDNDSKNDLKSYESFKKWLQRLESLATNDSKNDLSHWSRDSWQVWCEGVSVFVCVCMCVCVCVWVCVGEGVGVCVFDLWYV